MIDLYIVVDTYHMYFIQKTMYIFKHINSPKQYYDFHL